MDRGSGRNEGILESQETVPATGSGHLAILGQADSLAEHTLHPQTQSVRVRPCGSINPSNILRLLEWQEYRCALTGRPLTPESASLDHIVPVRDGGQHIMENVQVLHKDINRAKSTLAHEQFIQLCREVVEHAASANMEGVL